MTQSVEVYVDLKGQTVLVGPCRFLAKSSSQSSMFEYADSWLEYPDAFALDRASWSLNPDVHCSSLAPDTLLLCLITCLQIMPDIRWLQRFSNFRKALSQLTDAVEQYNDASPDIVKEGVLQRFEFTHELAWKVMKDYLIHEGYQNVTGSRTACKQAFAVGLLEGDGQVWMDMIESRNRTVHTYDEKIMQEEFRKVTKRYEPALVQFESRMLTLQSVSVPKGARES